MIRRPPRSTRTDTLFPYTTLFRSAEADILLIDEILGVGDYAFRRKCLEHLDRLRTENNTSIILVSHNPYQVQRLCDKVLMLDQGKKIRIDNAFKALELYFEFSPTRSEERRVGKECVSQCRSRRSQDH